MAKKTENVSAGGLKLNYKRTLIIGFAFFGILLLWQLYDSWCSRMLTELFAKMQFNIPDGVAPTKEQQSEVSYLVGVIMAVDNIAALVMLPIFGRLSDKTRTPLGKRMPYILVGTLVTAVVFPLIPLFFHLNSAAGVISFMAIVLFFMMMYRNPAVALMPDITPKPLRSKANGLINIMGYIGGGIATALGVFFSLTKYLGYSYMSKAAYDAADIKPDLYDSALHGTEGNQYYIIKNNNWCTNNVWAIMLPFIICSVIMIISVIILLVKVNENKLAKELEADMRRGEEEAEVVEKVDEDASKPISGINKKTLWLILIAEFLWFMASNAVATFQTNYMTIAVNQQFEFSMVITLIGGVGSVLGFALAGKIADKLGRKWTVFIGLAGVFVSYVIFCFTPIVPEKMVTALLIVIWVINGFCFSLVHTNSFPMVVEFCPSAKIGQFTGYYYASSMAAQTITPILLGLLVKFLPQGYNVLPFYAAGMIAAASLVFLFVKNAKVGRLGTKKGLAALDVDD
ncbi:MAG: MFS transporter [Bacilli bacterium]|nr:MFS transporter [Bacilli bacterium]